MNYGPWTMDLIGAEAIAHRETFDHRNSMIT